MQIFLYNGEALGKCQSGKRKKPFLVVLSVILAVLLVCACILGAIVHWSDISALFKEEEPLHEHSWNAWNTAIVKDASCVEDGLALHICETCGEEEWTVLFAYGHDLENNECVDCGAKASEGLRFTLKEDEEGAPYAIILGMGDCKDRALIIPSIIGGLPVKEIAESAFEWNMDIHSVSIPEGVEIIGENAFKRCKNLYTILLPQGVKEFGNGAFMDTAYYLDKKNWDEKGNLYRQGYLLESVDETTEG